MNISDTQATPDAFGYAIQIDAAFRGKARQWRWGVRVKKVVNAVFDQCQIIFAQDFGYLDAALLAHGAAQRIMQCGHQIDGARALRSAQIFKRIWHDAFFIHRDTPQAELQKVGETAQVRIGEFFAQNKITRAYRSKQ